MDNSNSTSSTIQARELTGDERLEALPRHFARHMLTFENAVYDFMRYLAQEYTGGVWKFFELSNGGFYMAPDTEQRFNLAVDTNGFEGGMSADAAGITVCLFALSHLSFRIVDDRIVEHFHLLRSFALEHAEASAIFAAID